MPEEQANASKYQERIARLRQSVLLHERNIEALRKELKFRDDINAGWTTSHAVVDEYDFFWHCQCLFIPHPFTLQV